MDERFKRLLDDVAVPPVRRVRQSFDSTCLEQPAQVLLDGLNRHFKKPLDGLTIAVTCGSRGIDCYVELLRTLVGFLLERGARPVLVPAMGSHGGATAAGQKALLAQLGVTEDAIGAPIVSSMETCLLGTSPGGLPVRIDRVACQADGIILFNRIKPHTSFRGRYESGLLKMLAIGLGKQHGAELTHSLRYERMARTLVDMAGFALQRLPILAGLATLENGYGRVSQIHVLAKDDILETEPKLLERAHQLMPRIYLDTIDVLIVRQIGKEISGTGMDTNIVGRFHTTAASGGPATIKLGVLDLTKRSGGNANGMGLADFTTRRMADKIDFTATYLNTLTSTEPASARLPLVLSNDRAVFQACVKLCGKSDPADVKMVIIDDTRSLENIWMSGAAFALAQLTGQVRSESDLQPLVFDRDGCLLID